MQVAGLKEESLVALRVAHLGMIQGAITRMSGFSASAKTFTVTILAGLAAISLQADQAQLGVIALLATIVLGVVDVYYMTLELRFRAFYDQVVGRNLDDAADLRISPLKKAGDIRAALNSKASKLFYLPVLIACALFISYGLIHASRSKRLPRTTLPCAEQPVSDNSVATAKLLEQLVQPTPANSRIAGQCAGRQFAGPRSRQPVRHEAADNTAR